MRQAPGYEQNHISGAKLAQEPWWQAAKAEWLPLIRAPILQASLPSQLHSLCFRLEPHWRLLGWQPQAGPLLLVDGMSLTEKGPVDECHLEN